MPNIQNPIHKKTLYNCSIRVRLSIFPIQSFLILLLAFNEDKDIN